MSEALTWGRASIQVERVEGRVFLVQYRGIVHHWVEHFFGREERVDQVNKVFVNPSCLQV